MRARKEMQDEEDERSATRIGQDRRTGDYRGRGFPGDERRSPAGFHLIPSWLTTDSLLPLSSSLSIPRTYCLSFCFQPFMSADVLLCLSLVLSLSILYGHSVRHSVLLLPSAFDQPPTLSLSFSLFHPNTRFLPLVVSLSTSICSHFLHFSLVLYSAFMIRLFFTGYSL